MSVVIRPFEGPPGEWDAFVRAAPGWTHYHLHGWGSVLGAVFKHECVYLEARSGADLKGVLPLVRVRSRLFGHYLVSMPFLNYGGPLGDDEAVRALGRQAASLAEQSGVDLLELRARRQLPLDMTASHRKVTVLLDVPSGDPDLLWKALPAKVRSQVRRPQKEGVTVRFGADMVEPFHQVFAQHMRDLGTPTQPARLFRAIAERFGSDVWFGCAFLAGQPVAAGCAFRWGNEVELAWASALREYSRVAPNMLLYWSFMERCVAESVETFNFGRCTPGSGTHQFKRQWGAVRDEPLWWYQAGPRAGEGTPSPDGGAFAWGPRIWRRLPLALTNRLGPAVVRYIP